MQPLESGCRTQTVSEGLFHGHLRTCRNWDFPCVFLTITSAVLEKPALWHTHTSSSSLLVQTIILFPEPSFQCTNSHIPRQHSLAMQSSVGARAAVSKASLGPGTTRGTAPSKSHVHPPRKPWVGAMVSLFIDFLKIGVYERLCRLLRMKIIKARSELGFGCRGSHFPE